MAHSHLLSACVFCFLCLTQVHCSEHSAHVVKAKEAASHDRTSAAAGEPPRPSSSPGALTTSRFFEKALKDTPPLPAHPGNKKPSNVNEDFLQIRNRRHKNSATPIVVEDVYVDKLFKKYQNAANALDLIGFKSVLTSLGLYKLQLTEGKENSTEESSCVDADRLVESIANDPKVSADGKTVSREALSKVCPLILYHLLDPHLCHETEEPPEDSLVNRRLVTWLYASGSVTIISLCGLFGVFVIPVMGKVFYQQLLQFLVALAIGTLCGDALLHLLPHALVPHDDHGSSHSLGFEHHHTHALWKSLAVLSGIIFFFFTEKLLMLGSEWRKKQQRSRRVQGHSHVQILNGTNQESVGEKLCKHKYSAYPYCYPDIKKNADGHEHSDVAPAGEELLDGHPQDCGRKAGEYDVIVREHTTSHHGHSHSHGHVHSAPGSLSSVAWMVILGDGLHNFTDGMAIGAAFCSSLGGGFSTSLAVFCHELPHELGDFAVLLKTGMSAKQAVFYNLISSVLCFLGMVLGMFVGSSPEASQWVFAVSAGMFLYIALVDMFPEMTASHSAMGTTLCQCCLQGLGMISGVGIMLVIAYYEEHLLTIFGEA